MGDPEQSHENGKSARPYRSLVIVADVGAGPFHVGDEAMLAANVAALRRHDPDVRVTVIGRGATATGAGGAARGSDRRGPGAGGLFLSGGGNLSSSWPDLLHQRDPLDARGAAAGLPVVTGGQTIGPELAPGERAALAGRPGRRRRTSGSASSPRRRWRCAMGVPADRLGYQPDDAFFLAGRPPTAAEAPVCRTSPSWPSRSIRRSPRPDSRAGLSGLAAQLARIAAESGLRLVFLPHVGPLGSPATRTDRGGGRARPAPARREGAGARCSP